MVDKYCEGCGHRITIHADSYCNYLLDVGTRRPCASGKGCTVHTKLTNKQVSRDSWGRERIKDWNRAKAKEMYFSGCTDEEIAATVGISKYAVEQWRKKNGWYRPHSSKGSFDRTLALQLVNEGKSNVEIGAILGANANTVGAWRRRNGLKPPSVGRWDKALARRMFYDGKTDKQIGAAVGRSEKTIQGWRQKENLMKRKKQ